VVGGVSFSGLESCDAAGCGPVTFQVGDPSVDVPLPPPAYVLPPELQLEALPAGVPARVLGVQVLILAVAIDATPEELFQGDDVCQMIKGFSGRLQSLRAERANVVAIKRLAVHGPDSADELNRNPSLPGIAGTQAEFHTGKVYDFTPLLPSDGEGQPIDPSLLYQRYTKFDADGKVIEAAEESWAYSWYVTAGSFEEMNTKAPDEEARWMAPSRASKNVPADGRVRIYTVVRDLRDGMDWTVTEITLASP
jgi:hypothetical protein